MKKDPKTKNSLKNKKAVDNEAVIDYNPDDMEVGEDLPGIVKNKGKKNIERSRDLNPDDFE